MQKIFGWTDYETILTTITIIIIPLLAIFAEDVKPRWASTRKKSRIGAWGQTDEEGLGTPPNQFTQYIVKNKEAIKEEIKGAATRKENTFNLLLAILHDFNNALYTNTNGRMWLIGIEDLSINVEETQSVEMILAPQFVENYYNPFRYKRFKFNLCDETLNWFNCYNLEQNEKYEYCTKEYLSNIFIEMLKNALSAKQSLCVEDYDASVNKSKLNPLLTETLEVSE